MNILGISGRKQSGKNTVANMLHGLVLKAKGLVIDFNIDAQGQLIVLTTNAEGKEDWGQFDITRKDAPFVEYAEHHMWPYVKLYSFADTLKWICTDLFDIPHECVWGTDEQKNQIQDHLLWENMPKAISSKMMKKLLPSDARMSWGWKEGPMTAREFMQFFGTDIMRKMYEPIWLRNTIKRIKTEKSELAIIADVRFENEVKGIEKAGGETLRLTRIIHEDNHSSEIALDNYPFTKIIENNKQSIDETMVKVKEFYNSLI